ncbi:uncharacterized protein [Primulina huaijiensis]|uniref:uncharacterized protein n=1 Tax=Primulina huaijiensis TaxID=1492673 RepID=UPI003CC70933
MHAEEADPDTTLLTGMIYIAGVATNALLDSGATHSFISDGFVKFLDVKPTRLDVSYSVTIPSGEKLSTSGMDWLSKNGVTIDFQQKSVRVRPLGEEEFVFEPSGRSNLPRMISCLQARKLILKECQAFLAGIISASAATSQTVAEVSVVRDFPDVFPDDIAGIPPEREVEFSIELMLGNVPISKAPYGLAPAEMKELKQQIQELLDKGFIRPSCSPWGAPGFSSIAVTLTALTKKNAKFVWSADCQKSFDTLKQALITAPILVMPLG